MNMLIWKKNIADDMTEKKGWKPAEIFLFCKYCILVFNISKYHQIEKEKWKKWLYLLISMSLFRFLAQHTLWFDAKYTAICTKTRCNLRKIAQWFDAICTFFQHDFTSIFALFFLTFWLPTNYKLSKNSAYLEPRRLSFQIRKLCESYCKYF